MAVVANLRGPQGLPGPSGSGLPSNWYDVSKYGLVDDTTDAGQGTDNSAALRALIARVAATGYIRGARFIWPSTNTGRYGFASSVNFGGKAIHNVGGEGGSVAHDGHYMTTICPLADNIHGVFQADGQGTLQFQGPSFENLVWTPNGHIGVTGLWQHQVNRVHLTGCGFLDLPVGYEGDEGGKDCAYNRWFNVIGYGCQKFFLGTAVNSSVYVGCDATSCTIAYDLVAVNQCKFVAGKMDTPLSGTPVGFMGRTGSYANLIDGWSWESGNWAGPAIFADIYGSTPMVSTSGANYEIRMTAAHTQDPNSIPIRFNAGANNNRASISFPSVAGTAIVDNGGSGSLNRLNGGGFCDLDQFKPASVKLNAGVTFIAKDSHKAYVSDGTTWRLIGVTT